MFNFWSELERYMQTYYQMMPEDTSQVYFELGDMKIPHFIASSIYTDYKDWQLREEDYCQELLNLKDYNRLLRKENEELRNND